MPLSSFREPLFPLASEPWPQSFTALLHPFPPRREKASRLPDLKGKIEKDYYYSGGNKSGEEGCLFDPKMLESLTYSQLARISLNFLQQRYAGEIFFLLQNGQLSLSAPFHLGSTPFRFPQKCGFQKRREKNILFHFRESLGCCLLVFGG